MDVNADEDPNHLANLNYAICIRVANGYCGIRYSQVANDEYSFTISGDTAKASKEKCVLFPIFLIIF